MRVFWKIVVVTICSSLPSAPVLGARASDAGLPFDASGENQGRYQVPRGPISQILEAEPLPHVDVSPDQEWLILTHLDGTLSIDELATPSVVLVGTEIDPNNNGLHGRGRAKGVAMTLVRVKDGQKWKLPVPADGLSPPLWSPDSKSFVFQHTLRDGIELWKGTIATKQVALLPSARLLALRGNNVPCVWLSDNSRVLCQEIPKDRGAPPVDSIARIGPTVRETSQHGSLGFIYTSHLKNAYDAELYEYFRTSQPVLTDIVTGERTAVGQPAIYDSIAPSPSGDYFLSVRIVRPYSYLYSDEYRFPRKVELLDARGVSVRTLLERPVGEWGDLWEEGWAPPLQRRFAWLPDEPATVTYIEALDGGDPRVVGQAMDRLMRLESPFTERPTELIRTRGRMAALSEATSFIKNDQFPNVAWLHDGMAWVEEIDYAAKRKRAWQVSTRGVESHNKLLLDFSTEGSRLGSGVPLLERGGSRWTSEYEAPILQQDGEWVYLSGREPASFGEQPLLDRFSLKTHRRERLFKSTEGGYEKPIAVLGDDKLLTRYETESEPANYYIRDLKRRERVALTSLPHPSPLLRDVKSQLLHYTRDDGVPLSAELCLPLGYKPGRRVPVFIWTYPDKYSEWRRTVNDRRQTTVAPFAWSRRPALELVVRSLSTQGYAVLWYPSMPIIGGEDGNDTAVKQMVANARAAVDKLVDMGVADRSRIAVGGHSYGGIMTGVLLANSDLFAAGIAVAGGYNLVNHPMGFATEPRTLWEAPQVYLQLSSLMRADSINVPMLLIHGEKDDTYVTPPEESQRMYQALNSLGRRARHVVLPYEGHGFVAKESIEHITWEMLNWLDLYIKGDEKVSRSAGHAD